MAPDTHLAPTQILCTKIMGTDTTLKNNRHRYTLGAGTYLTVSQYPLTFVFMLATNYL